MHGRILTVGHSSHSIDHFLGLLREHDVTAVADVRSVPASRYTPQFSRGALERELRSAGVKYVFLGRELGARSEDPDCYVNGAVQYDRLARTATFVEGIERLMTGMDRERIAIMCAEAEPLDCHRTILVANAVDAVGVRVDHILSDGRLESHEEAMQRLMNQYHLGEPDLLGTDRLAEALSRHGARIAYRISSGQPEEEVRA